MAVKAKDAISVARSLIGTPYAQLDCINLIKKIIRTAPGGVPDYTTAGSNTLWNSISMSGKYRDITEQHEGLVGIPAGALPFKRYGTDDLGHVGIATGEGTVIHSSSVKGKVVETPLTASEGWDCWGVHRYIETAYIEPGTKEETVATNYKMQVSLQKEDSTLNVRNEPNKNGTRIGRIGHGAVVTVQAEFDTGWKFITYGDGASGYVDGSYLIPYEEPEVNEGGETETNVTIVDSLGHQFHPVGDFRVYFGSID